MNKEPSTTGSGTDTTTLEAIKILATAFDSAIDDMAEMDDLDEIRQHLRDLYGAKKDRPLDYIITGFALGFTKGMFTAEAVAAAEGKTQSRTDSPG